MRLRVISIPAAGLFFISTVSTFLTLPSVKSLRSYTSSYRRTEANKYWISATQTDAIAELAGNKYQPVEKLAELCHIFATKNIKQSVTSDRTQWVNDALFRQIIASLDATHFLTASTFGSFLLLSPFPTNSIIFQGNNYALSLLMIPRGVEVQLPTSDKYNTFIYKPLRGSGELRKQKGQNSPEVIRMNGNDDFNTHYSDILIEPGGDKRKFYSQHSNLGPSVLLELSFNQGTAAGNHLTTAFLPGCYLSSSLSLSSSLIFLRLFLRFFLFLCLYLFYFFSSFSFFFSFSFSSFSLHFLFIFSSFSLHFLFPFFFFSFFSLPYDVDHHTMHHLT